ncbi:hypothetical protein TRVA0_019S01442 [Trichomonascus vanleenenianus]|uniref:uncharacterized protein n=1 Tax=Trichomonascus vanleenenianus TaxID=2268995 RepID=UPI003EC98D12
MLSDLPVEILEKIITYTGIDSSRLRQTCRNINSASLLVTWRQVSIASSGRFCNGFSGCWMDSPGLVDIINRYKDYIRVVEVTMVGCYEVKIFEKVPEILDLIWKKASGVQMVDILLEESLLDVHPHLRDWLRIVTGPFQESEPVVAVDYCSSTWGDYDYRYYTDFYKNTRSTVLMIARIKNLAIFEFKLNLDKMRLDLDFFRDVGKYIEQFAFYADNNTTSMMQ